MSNITTMCLCLCSLRAIYLCLRACVWEWFRYLWCVRGRQSGSQTWDACPSLRHLKTLPLIFSIWVYRLTVCSCVLVHALRPCPVTCSDGRSVALRESSWASSPLSFCPSICQSSISSFSIILLFAQQVICRTRMLRWPWELIVPQTHAKREHNRNDFNSCHGHKQTYSDIM